MTDVTAPTPSEPSAASAPASELPAAPAPAKSLGESLYPAPAETTPPESAPAAAPETPPAAASAEGDATPAETAPDAPPPEAAAPLTVDSYQFTFPEGFKADDATLTEAKSIFAEAGVPLDKAQALMSLYSKNLQAATEAGASSATAQFTELNTRWASEVNALPEFQGEAKKQTLAILGRTMDEFGSPEAREAFDLTGAGNNPAIVRYILSLANAVVEGSPTAPGAPSAGKRPRSLGERLYPNQTQ